MGCLLIVASRANAFARALPTTHRGRGYECGCTSTLPSKNNAALPACSLSLFVGPFTHCKAESRVAGRRCSSGLRAFDDTDSDDDTVQDSNSNDGARTRFRARVAYHGTPFHGWQLQPNRSTIQGEIEGVLTRRFHRRIPVLGAGRTDAGVHARGQAVHFDLLQNEIPFEPPLPPTILDSIDGNAALEYAEQKTCTDFCNELQHSMNRMLPLDIRLFNLQLAPYTWATAKQKEERADDDDGHDGDSRQFVAGIAKPWHVIKSASSKWYSYRFTLGPTLWNPMERYTRTHFVHRPVFAPPSSNRPCKSASIEPYAITKDDVDRLQTILRLYEGTHDFKAFGGQLEQNEKRAGRKIDTIRTVYRVELVKEPLKSSYDFGSDSKGTASLSPPHDQLGFIGEEGNYRIDFLLQGALYKQVRNMVGTAIEVWLGRMPQEQLVALLENSPEGVNDSSKLGRKDNPCKPAPPEGLCLECVYYDDEF